MNDFKNLHQTKSDPVSASSAPYVRYMLVCETTQNLGTHTNYVPNGFQQQAQTMYPFNVLHNSQVFAPPQNFHQRPQLLHESFQAQNAFWAPSNAVFQPAPSPTSPVTVTGYLVANPQLLQNSAGNRTDELFTNRVGITNQMFSPAYVTAQPMSLDLVNAGFQPEQIWLQQQHGQLLQNNHQQDDQLLQNNHQQHGQLLQNNQQQHDQLLQNNHQQHDQLLQNNHQQHDQLLQNNHQQHDDDEQKEKNKAHIKRSSQTSLNENLTNHLTIQSSTQNAEVKDEIAESVKTAQFQEGSADPRSRALPNSFPTTLNPSLQIKNPSRLKEPVALQKSEGSRVISGSNSTVNETKIKDQDDVNEYEIQLKRKNSQKVPVKGHVFQQSRNKDDCIRCNKKVYPMERTGPIKDAVYHKRCFTCVSCGTTLNLKNFHHNPNEADDLSVFCMSHKPKERSHSCDANSVFIKAALTSPKLDKVNEQIRTDRHPSEVLARSGHLLPTTSGLNTAQECFYYGMEVKENMTSDTSQKSNPEEDRSKVYVGDHHGQSQHQLVNEQHEQQQETPDRQHADRKQTSEYQQQETPDRQHVDRKQTSQYQHHELLTQNTQPQRGILENDKKLDDDVANVTISGIDRISMTVTDNQADEVFLSNDQNNILTTENDKDKQFPVSSLGFSQLSSATRQEINPGNEFESNLTTHFKLDNHEALQQQIQDMCNIDEEQKLITRERPSSQSSISTSSRSISPMQVHTSFSFSENEEGPSSSFSSDLSSRERSSFSSDLSSPGSNSPGNNLSNGEKTGLDTPAKQFFGDQPTRLTPGMRTDRPSTHQYYHDLDTHRQASPSTRMTETHMSNNKLDMPRGSSDDTHRQAGPSTRMTETHVSNNKLDMPRGSSDDTHRQAGPSTRMTETHVSNNKLDMPRGSSDDTHRQAGPSTRMTETHMSNNKLDMPRGSSDMDRFLPKNERMRQDRPSQYSREVK